MQPRKVNLGDLRSLRPISTVFGQDRGTTIRRYYIERFLAAERGAIRGRILEIGENRYSRMFGQPGAT